jgi:hypothetical protein
MKPLRISLEDVLVSSYAAKAAEPFLKIHLEDVLVSSFATSGGGDVLIDDVLIGSPGQDVLAGGPGDYIL